MGICGWRLVRSPTLHEIISSFCSSQCLSHFASHHPLEPRPPCRVLVRWPSPLAFAPSSIPPPQANTSMLYRTRLSDPANQIRARSSIPWRDKIASRCKAWTMFKMTKVALYSQSRPPKTLTAIYVADEAPSRASLARVFFNRQKLLALGYELHPAAGSKIPNQWSVSSYRQGGSLYTFCGVMSFLG